MFGASAPVAVWAIAAVAMSGVCVRFLSFNLERSERLLYLKSLNLAREWMLARKYTLRSGVVNYKSSDKFCSGDFLMGE